MIRAARSSRTAPEVPEAERVKALYFPNLSTWDQVGKARWKSGESVAPLAGKAVRLRFVMRDADLHALRFHPQAER
jgi:hypothetical protein